MCSQEGHAVNNLFIISDDEKHLRIIRPLIFLYTAVHVII